MSTAAVINSLREDLGWICNLATDGRTFDELQLLFTALWDELQFSHEMVADSAPVIIPTRRGLQLRALVYVMSNFSTSILNDLVATCMGAVGNCDTRVWELIFRCGFSSSSFPNPHALAARGGPHTDLMSAPLFPGGSHLLALTTKMYTQSPSAEGIHPSASNPKFHLSPAACDPLEDGLGRVVFPMSTLCHPHLVEAFLKDYFPCVLKGMWVPLVIDTLPQSRHHAKNEAPLFMIGGVFRLEGIDTPAIEQVLVHRVLTHSLTIHHKTAGAQAHRLTSTHSVVGDIEDLPPCVTNAVSNVKERGDHPKDPERLLIFGLLAFRLPREALMTFAETLDLDGTGVAQQAALSRTKKHTQTCGSIIACGMCPFESDGQRKVTCYSRMPGTETPSPAAYFENNRSHARQRGALDDV